MGGLSVPCRARYKALRSENDRMLLRLRCCSAKHRKSIPSKLHARKRRSTHPRCTMIDDMPLPSPIAYVLCDSHVRYVCTCVHASICTSDCTRWHDHVWRATSSCGGSQRTFCMCMPHGTRGLLLSLVALSEQCFEVLMRNAQLCVHPPNTHCGFIS